MPFSVLPLPRKKRRKAQTTFAHGFSPPDKCCFARHSPAFVFSRTKDAHSIVIKYTGYIALFHRLSNEDNGQKEKESRRKWRCREVAATQQGYVQAFNEAMHILCPPVSGV